MKLQKNIKAQVYLMIPFISNLPEQPDKVLVHSIQKVLHLNWKVMPMIILEKD